MKTNNLRYFVAALALSNMITSYANEDQHKMQTHPSQGKVKIIEDSNATILRNNKGVAISLDTAKLAPGNVYTLWFAVMNSPENCKNAPNHCTAEDVFKHTDKTKSDVVYADGAVANSKGNVSFNAFIKQDHKRDFWFKQGLSSPKDAEIHLVINDHGPVITSALPSMLTSYRGGCRDEGLPAIFPSTAKNDGIPGPNNCKLVQVAKFQ